MRSHKEVIRKGLHKVYLARPETGFKKRLPDRR